MPKLLQPLAAGADIAIGSRWLRAELQTQRQSLHRQLFGRIFNLLLRIILGLQFKDTQCGFKARSEEHPGGSDWSSDVCSSDLTANAAAVAAPAAFRQNLQSAAAYHSGPAIQGHAVRL